MKGESIVCGIIVAFVIILLCLAMANSARADETIRVVTAYNVGDTSQTDSTPCIDASNTNICRALGRGEKRCAANFVPLGTVLNIENYGTCKVTDRMNRRYKNRVDIAFPLDKKAEALKFGKQELKVEVIE